MGRLISVAEYDGPTWSVSIRRELHRFLFWEWSTYGFRIHWYNEGELYPYRSVKADGLESRLRAELEAHEWLRVNGHG